MSFRYHMVLGDKMVVMRWPEGAESKQFVDALIDKLLETKTEDEFSVTGDLVPMDEPIYNRSNTLQYIEKAFAGDPDHLRGFALWDFREGRFVTVNRPKKKVAQHGR